MSFADTGYEEFTEFLEKNSGICLGANKQYLVTSRLRNLMKEQGFNDLHQLLRGISKDMRGELKTRVVDLMTTNETLWFRDVHPFDILQRVILPDLYAANKGQPLRIWSAACSTGQEPYSISMVLDEYARLNPGKGTQSDRIVATDISPTVLADAKAAEYAMLALGRGLNPEKIKQYFDSLDTGRWRVKSHIRNRVEFKSLNLKDSYAPLGKFDIIFCRNVLIYFTGDLKRDILSRMHGSLKKGGYLMVGASEAVNGLNDKYEMVHCRPGIIYRAI